MTLHNFSTMNTIPNNPNIPIPLEVSFIFSPLNYCTENAKLFHSFRAYLTSVIEFYHKRAYLSNTIFTLPSVAIITSSKLTLLISAIFPAIKGIYAGSLELPRCGSGVK